MSRAAAWTPFERRIPRPADPGRVQRLITVKNGSGEVIPAFAAIEPYSVDRDGVLLVRKPTEDDSGKVLINSGSIIGIGDYGVGTNHFATWAYYADDDGTPATGEALGTRAGYWELFRGYEGFLVWGGATNERILVQRDMTCRGEAASFDQYYYYDTGRAYGAYGTGGGGGGGGGCTDCGGGDGDDDGTFCCRCRRFMTDGTDHFPATLDFTITNTVLGSRSLSLTKGATAGCAEVLGNAKVIYTGSYSDGVGGFTTFTYCNDSGKSSLQTHEEILTVEIYCTGCNATPNTVPSYWVCYYQWNKLVGGVPLSATGVTVMRVTACEPKLSMTKSQTTICSPIETNADGVFLLSQCCNGGVYYDDVAIEFSSSPARGLCHRAATLNAAMVGSVFQLDADEP